MYLHYNNYVRLPCLEWRNMFGRSIQTDDRRPLCLTSGDEYTVMGVGIIKMEKNTIINDELVI